MSEEEDERTRVWYSNSLEVLQPLRYHIHELIEEMESYNRYAARVKQPLLPARKIKSAKAVLERAENFFCGPERGVLPPTLAAENERLKEELNQANAEIAQKQKEMSDLLNYGNRGGIFG